MNPMVMALIRGSYGAIGTGLATGLVVYSAMAGATGRAEAALLAGGISALGYLGFRGGVEGAYDERRDQQGIVSAADVGQPRQLP